MTEPRWASRNRLLDQYNLKDSTVVDFGCGDKSILNYQSFRDYVGLDRAPTADIQIDFDSDTIVLDKHYDVGLVLGVLEYVKDPKSFVRKIAPFADRYIIMTLAKNHPKPEWRQSFTYKTFDTLLAGVWTYRNYTRAGSYIIAECLNKQPTVEYV